MSNFETQNALTVQDYNAPTAYDAFDYEDQNASPIRGASGKYDDGVYFIGREKTPIEPGEKYLVTDKAEGYVYLKQGCKPQYVMRVAGQPEPAQPFCDESEFVKGLDGKMASPWKYHRFIYMINLDTGLTMTLSGNTAGIKMALDDLTQQIRSMRNIRPGAMPVVTLESVAFPTKWGTRKRAHLAIKGWRDRTVAEEAPPQLEAPEYDNSREDEDVF